MVGGGVLVGLSRRQSPVRLFSGCVSDKRAQLPQLGFLWVNLVSMIGRCMTPREKMAKRDEKRKYSEAERSN